MVQQLHNFMNPAGHIKRSESSIYVFSMRQFDCSTSGLLTDVATCAGSVNFNYEI
jgi:hypothetical protein